MPAQKVNFDEGKTIPFEFSISIKVKDPASGKVRFRGIFFETRKSATFSNIGSALQYELYQQLRAVCIDLEEDLKIKGNCKEGKEHKWRPLDEKRDVCLHCTQTRDIFPSKPP